MSTQLVDFEGNFGSQDPALQPTAADFARLSEFFSASPERRAQLLAEAQAPPLPAPAARTRYPRPATTRRLA